MLLLDNVTFSFGEGEVSAVAGVSLTLAPGEHVAVVGANGSGKSTLARLACGLLVPASGSVAVDGIVTGDAARACEVHARVGFVQQDPRDQLVSSSVADEVAFGVRNLGLEPTEVRCRVSEALALAGLAGFGGRSTGELSGGEQQRLALAGVLAMRPRYLVLDEVTSMLDGAARAGLRALVRRLVCEQGIGVLHVTHDALDLLAADRVVELAAGAVVWEGSGAAFRARMCVAAAARADGARADAAREGDACAGVVRADDGRTGAAYASSVPAAARRAGDPAEEPVRVDPYVRLVDELAKAAGEEALGAFEVADAVAAYRSLDAEKRVRIRLLAHRELEGMATQACDGSLRQRCVGNVPTREADAAQGSFPQPAGLELRDVSLSYGAHPALRSTSVTAAPGRVLLVAGVSGSGKSTAACVLAGLYPPDEGEALLGGSPVRAGEVGLAFQRPEDQLFCDTVRADIGFGLVERGMDEDAVDDRIARAAARMGLAPRMLDMSSYELSGGYARRAAVACLVAQEPRAYVFDEPTAGLDAQGRRFMHRVVRSFAEKGAPVVVVSHDVLEWLGVADEVAFMAEGRIVWHGRAEEALAVEPYRRAGLEPPALVGLVGAFEEQPGESAAGDARMEGVPAIAAGASGWGEGR